MLEIRQPFNRNVLKLTTCGVSFFGIDLDSVKAIVPSPGFFPTYPSRSAFVLLVYIYIFQLFYQPDPYQLPDSDVARGTHLDPVVRIARDPACEGGVRENVYSYFKEYHFAVIQGLELMVYSYLCSILRRKMFTPALI